jgi:hypothetical protein
VRWFKRERQAENTKRGGKRLRWMIKTSKKEQFKDGREKK